MLNFLFKRQSIPFSKQQVEQDELSDVVLFLKDACRFGDAGHTSMVLGAAETFLCSPSVPESALSNARLLNTLDALADREKNAANAEHARSLLFFMHYATMQRWNSFEYMKGKEYAVAADKTMERQWSVLEKHRDKSFRLIDAPSAPVPAKKFWEARLQKTLSYT